MILRLTEVIDFLREEKKEKLDKMKSRRIRRIALVSVAAIGGGALIGEFYSVAVHRQVAPLCALHFINV